MVSTPRADTPQHVDIATPGEPAVPQVEEDNNGDEAASQPSSISSIEKHEMQKLLEMIKKLQDEVTTLKADLKTNNEQPPVETKTEDSSIILKPLNFKDIKAPEEYGGDVKHFLSWHESFTTMLLCRSHKWKAVIDFIKSKKEVRIKNLDDVKQELQVKEPQVSMQIEDFSQQLYRHLLDYTKDQVKTDILMHGTDGALENYRRIVHRGLSISEEKALDVEAKAINPRSATSDADIMKALQEWKFDRRWLV